MRCFRCSTVSALFRICARPQRSERSERGGSKKQGIVEEFACSPTYRSRQTRNLEDGTRNLYVRMYKGRCAKYFVFSDFPMKRAGHPAVVVVRTACSSTPTLSFLAPPRGLNTCLPLHRCTMLVKHVNLKLVRISTTYGRSSSSEVHVTIPRAPTAPSPGCTGRPRGACARAALRHLPPASPSGAPCRLERQSFRLFCFPSWQTRSPGAGSGAQHRHGAKAVWV